MTTSPPVPLPVLANPSAPRADETDRACIASDLQKLVRGDVRFDRHNRMLYATDASIYQVEPIGVVVPADIADAEAAVRYCAQHRVPILPRGSGTSLAGQAVNRAVIIDFSAHCRRLNSVDVTARQAVVEPGIVLDHLNAQLKPHGLMFGPDVAPSSHANIGGMIGNNSSGAHSIVYGRTVEHLLGLDVMLADGTRLTLDEGAALRDERVRDLTRRLADIILPIADEIDARFPKITRHVDGYNLDLLLAALRSSTANDPARRYDRVNLSHLICGSEGTLAVTLGARLNLVPTPWRTGLAIVVYPDVDAALAALMPIIATRPHAVELIDDVVIGLARENTEYRRYVDLLPAPPTGERGAVLYVAYAADDDAALDAAFNRLATVAPREATAVYKTAAEITQAWKLRKAGEPLLHGLPGARKPITFVEDAAVDPARLREFVREFKAIVARHGTTAAYYAHASVGCLHIRPLVNPRDPADAHIMQSIAQEVADLARRFGGALSGEHGDGRVRSHLLERYFGPRIMDAFRAVKAVFDPHHLLNPGNIVDPQPLLANLRVRPGEPPPERPIAPPANVKTFFTYEREHGFDTAIELCNGAGLCRRMSGGTMCPSYRATLDERHATRGRGNALRLAITGQFNAGDPSHQPWNDVETLNTLDLCLSCKACKSECPSNVDLAKLKSEYLAQGYRAAGKVPRKARMFGAVRRLNTLGSLLHPIANAIASSGIGRSLAARLVNMDRRRSIPPFSQSLYRWMSARPQSRLAHLENAPAVILYPDCFTVYNDSHVGRAAVLSLESLGYRVVLPKLGRGSTSGCCGRAMISTGLLAQAARTVRHSAESLLAAVDEHKAVAIVGCEPSCISAIKDDWLELDLGLNTPPLRQRLKELAPRTFLVEQFIEERWNQHPDVRTPSVAANAMLSSTAPVVLHGHCHQKALWGVETSAKILRRLLRDRLVVLDSGCCGMAGSFGYTADHYELSMKIGEQSLFAALREQPDAIILAPGTSCRHQIHDGVARAALHPIEFIAQCLGVSDRS